MILHAVSPYTAFLEEGRRAPPYPSPTCSHRPLLLSCCHPMPVGSRVLHSCRCLRHDLLQLQHSAVEPPKQDQYGPARKYSHFAVLGTALQPAREFINQAE